LAGLGLPADSIAAEWEKAGDKFMAWLQKDLMNTLYSITSGIFTVAKIAINLLIGIIVMIYLLYSRDHFIGQSKKLLYAICPNRKLCAVILESVRQINLIFGGFLTGKVIDSLIIGVICFVCLSILHIPYVMIISVVVGITNIIPVFGPFIGAIPSAFLLLLTDPAKCLVFIIFIIILQQVDGNVIGPMILGDSTGLPAFWVLFSLLLFQHLLGFWGMIIGVPLFASIYYLLKQLVNHLLRKRHLPISTLEYVSIEGIAEDGSPVYLDYKHKSSFFRIKQKRKHQEQSKHVHK
jgi:predicted PurR-regulated permease PerM